MIVRCVKILKVVRYHKVEIGPTGRILIMISTSALTVYYRMPIRSEWIEEVDRSEQAIPELCQ